MHPSNVAPALDTAHWMSSLSWEFEAKLQETGVARPKGVSKVLWAYMFLKEFNFVPPAETPSILKERTEAVRDDLIDLALVDEPEKFLIRENDRAESVDKLKGTALNRLAQVMDFFRDSDRARTLDHAQAWLLGVPFELEERHVQNAMRTPVSDTILKYIITGPATASKTLESFVRLADIGPYPIDAEHKIVHPKEVLSKGEVNETVQSLAKCRNRFEAQTNELLAEVHREKFPRITFKEFVVRMVLFYWREIEAIREFSGWSVLNEFPWAKAVKKAMSCAKKCRLMIERPLKEPDFGSEIGCIFGEEHKRLTASYRIREAPLSQRRQILAPGEYPTWTDLDASCRVPVRDGKHFSSAKVKAERNEDLEYVENVAFFQWRQQNPKAWCHFPDETSKRSLFLKESQRTGLGF